MARTKKVTKTGAKAGAKTGTRAETLAQTDELKPEMERGVAPPQEDEPTIEPMDEPVGDSSIEAEDTKEEINEDVAVRPAPKRNLPKPKHSDHDDGCHCYDSPFPRGKLPPPPVLQPRELEEDQKPKAKSGKDGVDKAMEILDDYYENVPMGYPNRED